MKIALLAGATGMVGKQTLYQLLNSDCDAVLSFGRRQLQIKHNKLLQFTVDFTRVADFDLEEALQEKNSGGDWTWLRLALTEGQAELHAFCALGTTIKQAGSQEKFKQIDQTFVLDFGKLCLRLGVKTFSYVSALGADRGSNVFYNRIKGETEDKLKELGFTHLLLHRPSLLLGDRDEVRFGETLAMYLMLPLKWLRVGDSFRGIEASKVARGMLLHAFKENPAVFKIIVSREMHQFTP